MLWRARVWRGRRCRVPRMRLGSRRRMATLGCPRRAWRSPRAAPASRAPRVARSYVSPPPRRVGVARLPPREPPLLSAARFPPERRGDLPVRRVPSDAPDRHPPRRRCGRPGPTPRACPPCAKAPGPCTGMTGYANTSCGVWGGEGRVRGGVRVGEARRRSFSGVGGPNALFLVEAKLVAQVLERAAQRLHAHTFLRVHLVLLGPRVVPHGHRGPAPGRDRVLKTMTSGRMGARVSVAATARGAARRVRDAMFSLHCSVYQQPLRGSNAHTPMIQSR